MRGSTLVILLVVTVIAALALTVAGLYINGSSTKTASLQGVLTVYTGAPESQPGPHSASYNVTLTSENGVGTLTMTQISGSVDVLPVHRYPVSDVVVSPYTITMVISGSNVSMGWITTSTIWTALNSTYGAASGVSRTATWNDLNSSYVASSGPNVPASATMGSLGPAVFQLSGDYNLFIGLTIPHQPSNTIPIVVGPAESKTPETMMGYSDVGRSP